MFYFDLQRFANIKTVKNGTTVDGLPPATSSSLGGVIIGTGVSVDSQGRISVPTATAISNGLMTSAEKTKLSSIAAGAEVNVINSVKVNNSALSVTDKAVNIDLTGYVQKDGSKVLSTEDFTTAYKNKLETLTSGTGEANVIEAVKVNGTSLAVTDKAVNIDLTGYVQKDGSKVLSTNDYTTADKNKLASIVSGATKNSAGTNVSIASDGAINVATGSANTPGVLKVGSNLSVNNGTVSLSSSNVTNALGFTPVSVNTTYPAASTTTDGIMSSTDKKKLDSVTSGAVVGLSVNGKNITYTKGDGTSSTITTQDTTYNTVTSSANGLVPALPNDSTKFLRGDGKWSVPPDTNTTYSAGAGISLSGTTFKADPNYLGSIQKGTGTTTYLCANGTWGTPAGTVTNTDAKVAQNVSTVNSTYPILLAATANATANVAATNVIFGKGVKVNPNTSVITAATFDGMATKASLDSAGNQISTTYLSTTSAASTYLTKSDASSTYLGKTAKAESAKTADSATKASQDSDGKTINTTYAPLANPVFTGTAKAPNISLSGTASIPTAVVTSKLTAASINGDAVYTLTGSNTAIALDRSGNNNNKVLSVNALAYWDGRWQATDNRSNLAYCNKGAFGTMATVNSPVPEANGGTGATILSAVTVGAATKASQDGNGKTINTTYAPIASPTFTGTVTASTIKGLDELQLHYQASTIPGAYTFAGIKTFYTLSNTAGKSMMVTAGQALLLGSGEGAVNAERLKGTADSLPGLTTEYLEGESTAIISDQHISFFTNTGSSGFSGSNQWILGNNGRTTLPGYVYTPRVNLATNWIGPPANNPTTVQVTSNNTTTTTTVESSSNLIIVGSDRTFIFAGDGFSRFGIVSDKLTCRNYQLNRIPLWIMPQGGPRSPDDDSDANNSEHMFLCADRSIYVYTNLQTLQETGNDNSAVTTETDLPQQFIFHNHGIFFAPEVRAGKLSLINTLSIANGGTGLTKSPSMLTNLGSTSAANVLAESPRPGVTGTLAVGNGGTGKTNLNDVTVGKANTLTTAQNIVASLGSTVAASFNGTAAVTVGTQGTLPVNKGGTGLTASPSMLTNLGSTSAANVLAASPRPGVTGTLGVANGGTGQTDLNKVTVGTANTAGSCTGNAATATKLANSRDFRVDLSSTLVCGFDGSDTCVPGVKNKLGIGNGGTGANSAAGARTNLGLGSLAVLDSVALNSNVTGTLPVANGGTGTNNLANITVGAATKASQDGNGKTISSTYAPLANPVFTGTAKAPNVSLSGTATIPTAVVTSKLTAASIDGTATFGLTAAGPLDWGTAASKQKVLVMSALAYWDGRYQDGKTSNLAYCNKGAFGSMATVDSPVPVNKGGTGATSVANARTNLHVPNNTCWWGGQATYTANNATLTATVASVDGNSITLTKGTMLVLKMPKCTDSTVTSAAYLNVNNLGAKAIYGTRSVNSTGTISLNRITQGYCFLIYQDSWVMCNYTIT